MNKLVSIALGIMTAIGGFVDIGSVVTAGQAGAKFGFGLIWALVLGTLATILLVEMSGRLSAVSGKTYADAIRERFGFKVYLLPLVTQLVANAMMLAAQMSGMAIALALFAGVDWRPLFPVATILVLLMVWRAPFKLIENGPALLGLTTLSFWVGIVLLGMPRPELMQTLWSPDVPQHRLAEYLFLAAAIIGATIAPFLIFFYSAGVQEEEWSKESLGINRITAVVGMSFGGLTAMGLMVLAALVLRPAGMTGGTIPEIGLTVAEPLGTVGVLLFATALFATTFGASLEVVLSVAYMMAEGFGWEWGENKKPADAPLFSVTGIAFLLVAVAIWLFGIDPLQLTLYAAVVTALVLPISLAPFLAIMNDEEYLGDQTNSRFTNYATVVVVVVAFVVAVVSLPLTIITGG